jgi:hypothetical protein
MRHVMAQHTVEYNDKLLCHHEAPRELARGKTPSASPALCLLVLYSKHNLLCAPGFHNLMMNAPLTVKYS